MTPEQAKALCIKAHEGRYRRPTTVKVSEDLANELGIIEINTIPYEDDEGCEFYTLPDGSKWLKDYTQSNTIQLYKPYSSHSIAVADLLTTDEEKVLGYLHDVLEDTNITYNSLYYKGLCNMSDRVRNALKLLTKSSGQNYKTYIFNISQCKLATKVKLADIYHNRSCNPSEHAKKKYLKAIPILLNAL